MDANHHLSLTGLTEEERSEAMFRFRILKPFFEDGVPLARVASQNGIPLRTASRWVKQYPGSGACGPGAAAPGRLREAAHAVRAPAAH